MTTIATYIQAQRDGYRIVALVLAIVLHSVRGVSQVDTSRALITIRSRHLTPEKLSHLLRRQMNCEVHVAPGLDHSPPFALNIHNGSFLQLRAYVEPLGMTLIAESRTIFIKPLFAGITFPSQEKADFSRHSIILLVTNEKDELLPDANVQIRRTGKVIRTHKDGMVILENMEPGDSVRISHIGRGTITVAVQDDGQMREKMYPVATELDETQVINYYSGSRRLQTGNIATVGSAELSIQPVSNALLALPGWIPGLLVTQTSGVHGAGVRLLVRGPASIASGTDPLILINRVPYAPNNQTMTSLPTGNAAGSLSPFMLISPSDIGEIEVLKDADATAIYGSRGAGGVILITTKKHMPGEDKWGGQLSTGIGNVTRRPALLNTREYTMMRREAMQNDGIIPDVAHVPELLLWDTTKYTDFGRAMIGGLSHTRSGDIWFSNEDTRNSYRVAFHYLDETNVFPGDPANRQATALGSYAHSSRNNRWTLEADCLSGRDWNHQYINDLTPFQFLTPNAPALTDPSGNLVFEAAGVAINNPYASLKQPYEAISTNVLVNVYTNYQLSRHWAVRANLGYNNVHTNESSRMPIASQDPAAHPSGSIFTAGTNGGSWIVEPQLERRDTFGKWKMNFLAGSTWQGQRNTLSTLSATGFTSDALFGQLSAAGNVSEDRGLADYRYSAVFSRLHFSWNSTWILNLTARRDGSSRFGPGRQFGNFGAMGMAWIFTNTSFFREKLPFISYGKLRGSYGITGNDQIGDYKFLTAWSTTGTTPYQNTPGFYPANLTNPNLAWEKVLKKELALETGLWERRLFMTIARYEERCSHQLIPYALPLQTGFSSELRNSGAVLVTDGWELTTRVEIMNTNRVQWSASMNITLPKNKLAAFPHPELSPYANTLVVGQSINVLKTFRLLGVDRDNGTYQFADINKDGKLTDSDRVVTGNWDPHWYGGFYTLLSVGSWQLDVHLDIRSQPGADYQAGLYAKIPPGTLNPGLLTNETKAALDRWTKKGENAVYQQFTTSTTSAAGLALSYYTGSSALRTDASFVRLKTLALSYGLPEHRVSSMHCASVRIFAEAQNLFTITSYQGTDPETQGLTLPPLRVIAGGIRLTFK